MSTKPPITCFNNQECIYDECVLFSKVKDLCRMEHFKEATAQVAPTETPTQTEPRDSPEPEGFVVGKWIDISGVMKDDPTLRKGTSTAGKDWKLASFRMDLPTATVRITLWGELATEAMQYVAGEEIALNGMLVKEFYEGTPQLNSGNYTKITVL